MLAWFTVWRERRKRMQWFADEFLPVLMAASERSGIAHVAAKIAGAKLESEATVVAEAAQTVAPAPQTYTAQSFKRLDEVLRALPDSERERLKAFVKSRGSD